VSADGRFVAFTSYSQLAPADTNSASDVYVLDRARRHVTLESAGTFTGDSSHPGISGDGRFVVFERAGAVVLHDRRDGVTTIVGAGSNPAISENGQVVAFHSSGFDRVAEADVNGEKNDIYSVNLRDGLTARRVSVDLGWLDASRTGSVAPRVSSDGRHVAFASKLQVPGSAGKPGQVFVRDTERQVTRLVAPGWEPSISGDGRFVTFVGFVNQLAHVYLADLQTGDIRVITNSTRRGLANGRSAKPAISPDGRFVAFQ
jgi:Tol biopolymer transport system component